MMIVCSVWKKSKTEFAGSTHCFKKQILKFTILMHPLEINKYLYPSSCILLLVNDVCG